VTISDNPAMDTEEGGSAMAIVPDVRRRDWEDPMTVEWNKRHAHVPLHCHTTIEGELVFFFMVAFRVNYHGRLKL